ncbi:uncharacterized protein LOC135692413 isoform X1 [Rhopilema esculentum]|uniref:uncharacterized protein LOC135692413 isoform X1 n=1 Tax=Rhopilema esculentum TaxID=499914 RepID=UPI0031CF355C
MLSFDHDSEDAVDKTAMTGKTDRRVTITTSHPTDEKKQKGLLDSKHRSQSLALRHHNSPKQSLLGSLNEDRFSEDFEEANSERETSRSFRGLSKHLDENGSVNFAEEEYDEELDYHGFDKELVDWSQHLQRIHAKKAEKKCERTPMGEYIIPQDGKPLTQQALATPGPSDYSPKVGLSKPSAPHYSIVGKTKHNQEQNFPGPSKYQTGTDLIWKNKTITVKGKGTMVSVKQDRGDWDESVGPATYYVKHGNLGSAAPKHAIGMKGVFCSGPPDSLVQPVDTRGFSTPGPAEYHPKLAYWGDRMEKSFGLSPKKREPKSLPGPAEYNISRDRTHGPSYSFGTRLKENIVTGSHTPGPGAYQIGTTIGKSVAKSIAGRQIFKNNDNRPSPNTYILPSSFGKTNMLTMTYRPFETAVEASPGPAEYEPRNENLRKGPEFTCGRRCRLSYPDVLHHWDQARNLNPDVSPLSYNPNRDFSKNDKPTYSIGKRFKEKNADSPGPASYNVSVAKQQKGTKQPSFSIGKRIEKNIVKDGPGPAAYYPEPKINGPSYSMSGWNVKKRVISSYPAANAYTVGSNQTRKGLGKGPSVTLKGRPSPFLYSGFSRPIQA